MKSTTAELLFDVKNIIGEGSIWDNKSNTLYWVDIINGIVFSHKEGEGFYKEYPVGQYVGTVVIKERGGLALAVKNGFAHYDLENNKLDIISDPEEDLPENRFNDGKCDPAGRFWAGTMQIEPQDPVGGLYCLDTDGSVEKKLGNITISNGIVWSLDHKRMYYIDTPTYKVKSFLYNEETGNIEFEGVAVHVDISLGFPDGMCIDENGNLWVAMYGGSSVCCFNPNTGELIEKIQLPTSHITSCAFGGKDLDTLYITSAANELSEQQLKDEPHAGGVFYAKPGVKGVPSFYYKG